MSLHLGPIPESISVNNSPEYGHRSRSSICGGGSTGTQFPYCEENSPTVDVALVHGLERATKKTWVSSAVLKAFWLRHPIPHESQPRSGRMMTFGYNADVVPQNQENAETDQSKRQRVFALLVLLADQDRENIEHLMDRPPRMLHRKVGWWRDPVQGGGVDKHYQILSHLWGQQGIKSQDNIPITKTDTGEDANYNSQDEISRDSYKADLGQFIRCHSAVTADSPKFNELVGFPRYRRLRRVLESFISPAVILSYPTTASAAALSWRCSHCSSDSNLSGGTTSSNVASILPWSPGRQILQFLAICGVASVLIYLQGTGTYLKSSFMIFVGLLALICVSAGTETMLRFLPLVAVLTLLASWICQVLAKIIRGRPFQEIQDESVATPGCALMEKNPQLSVTEDTFRGR